MDKPVMSVAQGLGCPSCEAAPPAWGPAQHPPSGQEAGPMALLTSGLCPREEPHGPYCAPATHTPTQTPNSHWGDEKGGDSLMGRRLHRPNP